MLKLTNICKSYTTADFTQVALDNINLAFRKNEFVAILGPSGSGKTTLLNIVGGLDHYDSGDLIIDGISTEEYKDRDWDTYRNNRIGFVFQSYNLIPHQTILSNVELALTLSGIPRAERRTRAVEALTEVGLEDHINKKPSQLSGGQMQRVAIARALINNPEILLADEPTGALDSKTSVQIMDLLTNIAKDRLVIMVTHNPDLAEEYATRTVTLADGKVVTDTDPYTPNEAELKDDEAVRKTHMSFLTALTLSFQNLMTKKGRTLMTAFAGSIGIIGIAAILALANGVNNYIKSIEEETLSEYPLQIQSTGLDLTSMMLGATGLTGEDSSTNNAESDGTSEEGSRDSVQVAAMMTEMLSSVGSNDLASLKAYFESGQSDIDKYTNAIEYSYNAVPQIFNSNTETIRQVNPDKSFSALGLGSGASSNSLMSMSMSTDQFYEMPTDPGLYENQYDVLAGRWPEEYNELVLVLSPTGACSDFMLYTLGLRDATELDEMVKKLSAEEEISTPTDIEEPSYDQILSTTFKLVDASSYYEYDSELGLWRDKSKDKEYLGTLVEQGEELKIVGIVQPFEDAKATMLSIGLNYPASLTNHIIDKASESEIVKDQMNRPDINVFTGKPFDDESESDSGFSMDSLFSVNGEALQSAFTVNESALSVDMSNALNLSSGLKNMPAAPEPDLQEVAQSLGIEPPTQEVAALMSSLMEGYAQYLTGFAAKNAPYIPNPAYDPSDPTSQKIIANPAYDPNLTPMSAQDWLNQPAVQQKINEAVQQMVDEEAISAQLSKALQGYVQSTMQMYMGSMAQTLQTQVTGALQQSMNALTHNMASALYLDPEKFKDAFSLNMTEEELGALMMSLMQTEEANYDNNLKKMGYVSLEKPSGIAIYPIDFASKEKVIQILDDYNKKMEDEGQEDKVITYTDFVGALMSSVTDIVNMISYVLVAFVAISLIVSSIMIGVITYISVLERKKEIGILRSIGASKKDISRVFNAETIIVGFAAGLIGIGLTALGCLPANAIVNGLFGVPQVAILPWKAALVLIAISVALTYLAGLIPSKAASRKDPVEALRSE